MGAEELHDLQLLHGQEEVPPRPPSRMHPRIEGLIGLVYIMQAKKKKKKCYNIMFPMYYSFILYSLY